MFQPESATSLAAMGSSHVLATAVLASDIPSDCLSPGISAEVPYLLQEVDNVHCSRLQWHRSRSCHDTTLHLQPFRSSISGFPLSSDGRGYSRLVTVVLDVRLLNLC